MNVRIHSERTSARRLAALLRTYLQTYLTPPPATPDYADIAQDIELYTRREEVRARVAELQHTLANIGDDPKAYFQQRIVELVGESQQIEDDIRDRGLLR